MEGMLRRVRESSKITAGSLPPSSTHTGMRDLAADVHTWWATGRDPMKVICAISGCEVNVSATLGKQTSDWTRSRE